MDRSPVGTSFLFDFYSGEKGQEGDLIVSFDFDMLAPGNYTTNYTFFERDAFGNHKNVDCVHGLYFEILNENNLVWDEKSWGNVILPQMVQVEG